MSLGYNVVDPPFAWDKVTRESLVYSIHCYNDIVRSVLDDTRPAMMIRNILYSELWYINHQAYNKQRLIRFRNPETHGNQAYHTQLRSEYHEDDFPQPQKGNAFSDTKIYWRNIVKPATPPTTPPPTEQTTVENENITIVKVVQQATIPASVTPVVTAETVEEVIKQEASSAAAAPTVQGTLSADKEKVEGTVMENDEKAELQAELEGDKALARPVFQDSPVNVTKPEASTVNPLSAVDESVSESIQNLSQEDSSAAILTPIAEEPIANKNLQETNFPLVTTGAFQFNPKIRQEASIVVGGIVQQVGMIICNNGIPDHRSASPASVGGKASKTTSISGAPISPMRSNSSRLSNSPQSNFSPIPQARLVQRNNSPGSSRSSSSNTTLQCQQREYIEAKAEETKARVQTENAAYSEKASKQADAFSIWLQRRRSTSPTNTDAKKAVNLETRGPQQQPPPSIKGDLLGEDVGENSGAAELREATIKIEDGGQAVDASTLNTYVIKSELVKEARKSDAVVVDATVIKQAIAGESNESTTPVVDGQCSKDEPANLGAIAGGVIENANTKEATISSPLVSSDAVEEPTVAKIKEQNAPAVDVELIDRPKAIENAHTVLFKNSLSFTVDHEIVDNLNDSSDLVIDVHLTKQAKSGSLEVDTELVKVASEPSASAAASQIIDMSGEICQYDASSFNEPAAEGVDNQHPKTSVHTSELENKVGIIEKTTTDVTNMNEKQPTINIKCKRTTSLPVDFIRLEIDTPKPTTFGNTELSIESSSAHTPNMIEVFNDVAVADKATNASNSNEEQLARFSLDDQSPNSSIVATKFVNKVIVAEKHDANGSGTSEFFSGVKHGHSTDVFIIETSKYEKVVDGSTGEYSDISIRYSNEFGISTETAKNTVERSTADTSKSDEKGFSDDHKPATSVSESNEAGEGMANNIKNMDGEPYKITLQAVRKGEFMFKFIKFHGPIMMKNLSVGRIHFGEVEMPNGLLIEVSEG